MIQNEIPDSEELVSHQPIWSVIKDQMRWYYDSTILPEIAQNADDASSSEMSIILDDKCYGTEQLITKKQYGDRNPAPLQGPALIIMNDSIFEEKDWKGIAENGTGSKQKDVNSVGKFGRGFNSVYHLTDCPQIVSGEKFYFPDVLGKYFPPSAAGNGFKHDYSVLTSRCDQFQPFEERGCDRSATSYPGTIFRLPLRTEKSIIGEPKTVDDVRDLINRFIEMGPYILLFLRNVRKLTIWMDGKVVYKVEVQAGDDVAAKINVIKQFIQSITDQIPKNDGITPDQAMDQFRLLLAKQSNFPVEHYQIGIKTTDYRIQSIIDHPSMNENKLIPTGGIATPLTLDPDFRGRLFCYLPIGSMSTHLQVHVHGYFYTSSSRTNIIMSEHDDKSTSSQLVDWNKVILDEIVPTLYHQNLVQLNKLYPERTDTYLLFPTNDTNTDVSRLNSPTLAKIIDGPSPLFANEFATEEDKTKRFLLRDLQLLNGLPPCAQRVLRECNVPCILLPNDLLKVLESNDTFRKHLNHVSKEYICTLLKTTSSTIYDGDLLKYLLQVDTNSNSNSNSNSNTSLLLDVPIFENVNGHVVSLKSGTNLYSTESDCVMDVLSPIIEMSNTMLSKQCYQDLVDINCLSNIQSHYKLLNINYPTLFSLIRQWYFGNGRQIECDPVSSLDIDKVWAFMLETVNIPLFQGHLSSTLLDLPIVRTSNSSKWIAFNHPRAISSSMLDESIHDLFSKLNFHILDFASNSNCNNNSNNILLSTYFQSHDTRSIILNQLDHNEFANLDHHNKESTFKLFLLDPKSEFRASMTTQHKVQLSKLPIFDLYPNMEGRLYSPLFGTVYSCEEDIGLYTIHLTSSYFVRLDQSYLDCCPPSSKSMSFSEFNQSWILPHIDQFPSELHHQAITHLLENIKDYHMNQVKSMRFVPAHSSTIHGAPQSMYFFNKDTAILSNANMNDLLIDQGLCTDAYSDPWMILTAKAKLDINRIQDIAKHIASTNDNELYDQFIELLSSTNSNYTDNELATLSNINWIRVDLSDHKVDEGVILTSLKVIQGSSSLSSSFSSPSNCARPEDWQLCFTNRMIADLPASFSERLKLILFHRPSLEMVITHLGNISEQMDEHSFGNTASDLTQIIDIIYLELKKHIPTSPTILEQSLSKFKWIWCGRHFTTADSVAFKSQTDLTPYLFEICPALGHHRPLYELFGVPENYNLERFVLVINAIEKENSKVPLPKDKLQVVLNILQDIGQQPRHPIEIYVPADNGVLYPNNQILICKGGDKLPVGLLNNDFHKINEAISNLVANNLGIISDRQLLHHGEEENGFGQYVNLHTTLKKILKDGYDAGSLMGEMIQNADDAEATQMDIVMDLNDYSYLVNPENAKDYPAKYFDLLGPSITFINNRPMSPQDIKNIQSVGDSVKMNDSSSIGRFGHGFNSVFNITDIPSMVANEHIYFFDVHQNHFDQSSYFDSNKKGKKFSFINTAYIDPILLEPYKAYKNFGLDLTSPFNQTLFRLPMRKSVDPIFSFSDWTRYDNIAGQEMDDNGEQLFQLFISNVEKSMLFLPNIRTIKFHRMVDGTTTLIHSICRTDRSTNHDNNNNNSNNNNNNNSVQLLVKPILDKLEGTDSNDPTDWIAMREFLIEPAKITRKWLIGRRVGGPMATALFRQSLKQIGQLVNARKRLPIGGAAIPIGEHDQPFVGQVFSTLPTKILTGLDAHIDGYFELHSSRTLIEDTNAYPKGVKLDVSNHTPVNMGTLWNMVLFEDIIAPMMVQLMIHARDEVEYTGTIDNFMSLYDHFPDVNKCLKPFTRVIDRFYELAINQQLCIRISVNDVPSWFKSTENSLHVSNDMLTEKTLPIINTMCKYKAEVLRVSTKLLPKDAKTPLINGQLFSPQSVRNYLYTVTITLVDDALLLFDYLDKLFQVEPESMVGLTLLSMHNNIVKKIERAHKDTFINILYTDLAFNIHGDASVYVHPKLSLKLAHILGLHQQILHNYRGYNEATILYRFLLNDPLFRYKPYDTILKTLTHLRDVYHLLGYQHLTDLKSLVIIPLGTSQSYTMTTISHLHDPSDKDLKLFSLSFPPTSMQGEDWRSFWTSMHLKSEMSEGDLIRECQTFSSQYSTLVHPAEQSLTTKATYLVHQLEKRHLLEVITLRSLYSNCTREVLTLVQCIGTGKRQMET
ncbi:hypothetical protein SAMD00019534_080730 [Acytostelium subglobosum LB1]|uniref:hypothetical protein n=1 Tax=Acytostelium subglobosum LB1 TaxID=1410327 RepID=UPI0006449AC0|nr:hypothetical protein SAMD00019534_080730 [Acytostelium subglobosum LB1]GAM24898.1 hypothetical protein SAMD00019534_080730 [Acytostelium subglobosum LB1]|eukprot:XP_012751987.1 hypothetical protein SAMD00019534_080730 [Acytostelium subglobosum LB1]